MQINKDYEPEINLRDLFFHILYRWRSILIFAIICAIAAGAYQYFSVKKVHDAGKLTKDERQYQLDLQKYQEDLEGNKTKITALTKRLNGQRQYQNKSIYIRLDAQNVWMAQSKYLVKVDKSVLNALPMGTSIDPADSILSAYSISLSGDLDEQYLKDVFNTDEVKYIKELVSVWTDSKEDTITVSVKGSTKENAEKGLAFINQLIKELSTGKAQEINPHQLVELSSTSSLGVDDGLAQNQANLIQQMTNDQETLQQTRSDLDTLEAKGEPSEPGDHVKKMAVIGFVIGIILLAGLYLLGYVLSGKLKDGRMFTEKYNLPIFGELIKNGSLHNGRSLDKLIIKWETAHNKTDNKKIYDKIASLIREQGNINELFLVSTRPDGELHNSQQALSERLPQMRITTKGDFNQNSETISDAIKAEVIVLIEEKNVSIQRDVDSMAEALIIGRANAIGAIII